MESTTLAREPRPDPGAPAGKRRRLGGRFWALLPLVLLTLILGVFSAVDAKVFGLIGDNPPAPDELSFGAVQFKDDGIFVRVTNPQTEPLTIASVTVDGAIALFEVDGSPTMDRLDRRTIEIPFAWNAGEPYEIGVTSSTGVESVTSVAAAVPFEGIHPSGILGFALIGLLVGVIPVALGLMWLPGLRTLSQTALVGFMALTAGLLTFLALDALFEAFEQQALLPGALGGTGLILLGVAISFIGVAAFSDWLRGRERGSAGSATSPVAQLSAVPSGTALATAIAVGIGLHNLGEGLAIGTSFALGELALGSLLIVGFTVHNITEGLGIAVPLADATPTKTTLGRLAALALIAGLPAVAGAWIGGFVYSNLLATLFFAIAAGAAAQVVYEVSRLIGARSPGGWTSPVVGGGFLAGIAIMYVTSLIAG
ncbi:MAG: metal transporter [Actinobacteria bacterium]|nr:metal transporter [Actinomycetota bacterium]